jgi:hypothetical protein
LRERSNASRFVSFPKEDGMLPIKTLFDKLSKTRPFNSPIIIGISPVSTEFIARNINGYIML